MVITLPYNLTSMINVADRMTGLTLFQWPIPWEITQQICTIQARGYNYEDIVAWIDLRVPRTQNGPIRVRLFLSLLTT